MHLIEGAQALDEPWLRSKRRPVRLDEHESMLLVLTELPQVRRPRGAQVEPAAARVGESRLKRGVSLVGLLAGLLPVNEDEGGPVCRALQHSPVEPPRERDAVGQPEDSGEFREAVALQAPQRAHEGEVER
ncbi:MAG: hypothetical protein H6741_10700 [Alphaproteobacteria bacterium]|nr:hypothetical protein [Alphaproteobacteria bacterium]